MHGRGNPSSIHYTLAWFYDEFVARQICSFACHPRVALTT